MTKPLGGERVGVMVYLLVEERDALVAEAAFRGVTLSSHLRERLLGSPIGGRPEPLPVMEPSLTRQPRTAASPTSRDTDVTGLVAKVSIEPAPKPASRKTINRSDCPHGRPASALRCDQCNANLRG